MKQLAKKCNMKKVQGGKSVTRKKCNTKKVQNELT